MQYFVAIIIAVFGSTGFWSWIANRRVSNQDILGAVHAVEGRVAALEERLGEVSDDLDVARADSARIRVLRFNGEILRGVRHTEEEFSQVLSAVDFYEDYCATHPHYPNNKAGMAVANIKRVYESCLKEHDFL